MEIRDVETFVVGTPPPHDGGYNWVFVRLTTDDGVEGWGECNWTEYREETIVQAVEDLSRFAEGADPHEIERLRERMYDDSHFLHAPGPVHAQAVAAYEMACWDIVGKAVDQPVYNLLGGKVNDELRAYTYIHYRWEPPMTPEQAADAAEAYVSEGFSGLKLDPLPPITGPRNLSLDELEYAEEVVAAIREAVGTECDILFGTHGQLYTRDAVRLARRLEPHDPLWFEEPVAPENIEEMIQVAESTSIPVATGERITSPHVAAEVIERGAADIIQPNVGLLGILGAKKVAGVAETQYTGVAPWMYCGPVAGAANVQVDACTPNFLIQESIEDWGGFHNEILREPVEFRDGAMVPPDRPGLGVEPDPDVLAAHPPVETPDPEDRPHYTLDANRRKIEESDRMEL